MAPLASVSVPDCCHNPLVCQAESRDILKAKLTGAQATHDSQKHKDDFSHTTTADDCQHAGNTLFGVEHTPLPMLEMTLHGVPGGAVDWALVA